MELDIFDLLFSGIVFFIYGIICIISVIFTFSLPFFRKIDEFLSLQILARTSLKSWELNINQFDILMKKHNLLIGPLLIVLSILDIKFWLDIIWFF